MVADIATALDDAIRQLEDSGIDRARIEPALRLALESSNLDPLIEWAREQGDACGRSGSEMHPVVEQVEMVARAAAGLGIDGDSNQPPGGAVRVALVSAALDGYIAAHDSSVVQGQRNKRLSDMVAEMTALHRINSAANSSLKLGDMLNEVAQTVVAVTHADVCTILLYEQEWDQIVLTATSNVNQDSVGKVRLQVGEGITGWAARLGKPVAVKGAWGDPRFKSVPVFEEEKMVSMLAVPIVLYTKEKLVGVIAIHTFEECDFSDNEIKFLETVAGELAIAIENARLYEQTDARLQQKVAELSTLQGVSAHIAATLDLSEVLGLIAHQSAQLVKADAAAIYELYPEAGILELVAQYDPQDPNYSVHEGRAVPHIVLSTEQSEIARAMIRGIPVALPPDTDSQMGLPMATQGYGSMFCVPLVAPRGIMGGICIYSKEATIFTEEQVRLLDAFAHEAAIALENSRLYDAALRGLRTKSAMLQEMNHRVRNNLQTVAGLLSMQLRRISPDSEAATAVRESIARIQSMAAVHDLMVRGDVDVQSTSIYELARQVSEAAVSTLSGPGFRLVMNVDPVDAENIRVGSHQATLLALLFNEIISNAILHGFAGKDKGEISIRAWYDSCPDAGDTSARRLPLIKIEVTDNGAGLPPGFDPQREGNLGLNIIRTLVLSDLRGDFTMEPGPKGDGTRTTISFRAT